MCIISVVFINKINTSQIRILDLEISKKVIKKKDEHGQDVSEIPKKLQNITTTKTTVKITVKVSIPPNLKTYYFVD